MAVAKGSTERGAERKSWSSSPEGSSSSSPLETSAAETSSDEWATSNSGGDTKSGTSGDDEEPEVPAVRGRVAATKPTPTNEYEAQRRANIERNLARFRELGINNLVLGLPGAKLTKPPKAPQRGTKRCNSTSSECVCLP